jgi:hypothetical protein
MATIDEVLTKLLERTDAGKVNWKPTADEQTFVAALGNASVMIQAFPEAPKLSILNKAGVEIEALGGNSVTLGGKAWAELADLYVMARRVALGVDSQLDDLMRELETVE